jgi:hypothetical protein
MRAFYGKLTTGFDTCDAIRAAMLELRETRPHPYFWAPFAYVGRLPGTPIFSDRVSIPLEMRSRAGAF